MDWECVTRAADKTRALKIFSARSGKIPDGISVFLHEKGRIRPIFLFPEGKSRFERVC
jgi:hypothetical protein